MSLDIRMLNLKCYADLAIKYNKPEKGDEKIQEWLKNKSTVREYYKEVAKMV